jgi:hypothetical protein
LKVVQPYIQPSHAQTVVVHFARLFSRSVRCSLISVSFGVGSCYFIVDFDFREYRKLPNFFKIDNWVTLLIVSLLLNIFLGVAAGIIEKRRRPKQVEPTIIKIEGRWIPVEQLGDFQVADEGRVSESCVTARVVHGLGDDNNAITRQEELIGKLESMGFGRSTSRVALERHDWDLGRAADFCSRNSRV